MTDDFWRGFLFAMFIEAVALTLIVAGLLAAP